MVEGMRYEKVKELEEEKFKTVDLVFQEIKDQQEDEAMEKQLQKADVLLLTAKDKEHNESKKAEIK